jgi:hypothetical protein
LGQPAVGGSKGQEVSVNFSDVLANALISVKGSEEISVISLSLIEDCLSNIVDGTSKSENSLDCAILNLINSAVGSAAPGCYLVLEFLESAFLVHVVDQFPR